MGEMRYCMGCGEHVGTVPVERDGKTEIACIYCGFPLDVVEEKGGAPARCIVTADDAEFIRRTLKEFLVQSRLAEEVIVACDGSEFVSAISRRLPAGQSVDLAILDIEMPVMDGFTAARVLRSLEAKLSLPPCPIIFFSSKKPSESLKKQMALYSPVRYLNKGAEGSTEDLKKRVAFLVSHLGSYFENGGRGTAS